MILRVRRNFLKLLHYPTLYGNEIELGMKIPTIESRASNIPMTKGITYVVIRTTDKDLRRICGNQYEHPGSVVGY